MNCASLRFSRGRLALGQFQNPTLGMDNTQTRVCDCIVRIPMPMVSDLIFFPVYRWYT